MYHKTRAIVLNQLKYSDTSIIATLYTELFGRRTCMVQGVFKKKSKFPPVFFQPFTILEIELAISPKRELQRLKEATIVHPFHSIPFDPVKNAIVLFLSEVVYKTLREEEQNTVMFSFLENAIELLDRMDDGKANFHNWFLIQLTKYLGFYPSENYTESNCVFDLINGRFYDPSLKAATEMERETARWIYKIICSAPDTLNELKLNHELRNKIAETLIEYYHIHLGHFGNIKSLTVLQGVFT